VIWPETNVSMSAIWNVDRSPAAHSEHDVGAMVTPLANAELLAQYETPPTTTTATTPAVANRRSGCRLRRAPFGDSWFVDRRNGFITGTDARRVVRFGTRRRYCSDDWSLRTERSRDAKQQVHPPGTLRPIGGDHAHTGEAHNNGYVRLGVAYCMHGSWLSLFGTYTCMMCDPHVRK
jgi:hypothetical protein